MLDKVMHVRVTEKVHGGLAYKHRYESLKIGVGPRLEPP